MFRQVYTVVIKTN